MPLTKTYLLNKFINKEKTDNGSENEKCKTRNEMVLIQI